LLTAIKKLKKNFKLKILKKLDRVSNWCQKMRLKYSSPKTDARYISCLKKLSIIIFSRKGKHLKENVILRSKEIRNLISLKLFPDFLHMLLVYQESHP
jgi:hypothetical protein